MFLMTPNPLCFPFLFSMCRLLKREVLSPSEMPNHCKSFRVSLFPLFCLLLDFPSLTTPLPPENSGQNASKTSLHLLLPPPLLTFPYNRWINTQDLVPMYLHTAVFLFTLRHPVDHLFLLSSPLIPPHIDNLFPSYQCILPPFVFSDFPLLIENIFSSCGLITVINIWG